MNDPESQDIDSDSQEYYQEEHVQFNPPVSLQHNLQNGTIVTNCRRQGK